MTRFLGYLTYICAAILTLFLTTASPARAATPEGTIYAFGDSLLDLHYVCPVEYMLSSGRGLNPCRRWGAQYCLF